MSEEFQNLETMGKNEMFTRGRQTVAGYWKHDGIVASHRPEKESVCVSYGRHFFFLLKILLIYLPERK